MFVVMVDAGTIDFNYRYSQEYSGTKHDNYMDAENELYDARQEGLTAYIKEVD